MRNLKYFILISLKNFFLGGMMSYITTITIAMAIFILGFFILIQKNAGSFISDIKSKSAIIVYLEKNIDKKDRIVLEQELKNIKEIDKFIYIDENRALNILKKDLGKDADILEGLTGNPLPASYEIYLKKGQSEKIKYVVDKLTRIKNKIKIISDIDYSEKVLKIIKKASKIINLFFFSFGIILSLGSIFIIGNTIRLAFFARKDEIDIMKLVGANSFFISMPFILEGIIHGISGSIIANLFLFLFYKLIIINLQNIKFLSLNFYHFSLNFFFQLILIGILIGFLGSYFSIKKLLRYKKNE